MSGVEEAWSDVEERAWWPWMFVANSLAAMLLVTAGVLNLMTLSFSFAAMDVCGAILLLPALVASCQMRQLSKRLLQLGFLSHAALFGEELRGHVLAVATLSYGQPRSVVLMGGYVMEATACLAALTLNLFLQAQDIASMLAASESSVAAAMLWSDLDAKAPISIGLGPMSIKSSLRVCMVILWLNQFAACVISWISLPSLDPENENLRDPSISFVLLLLFAGLPAYLTIRLYRSRPADSSERVKRLKYVGTGYSFVIYTSACVGITILLRAYASRLAPKDGATRPDCHKDQNTQCAEWAKAGYCQKDSDQYEFMFQTCQAACHFCWSLEPWWVDLLWFLILLPILPALRFLRTYRQAALQIHFAIVMQEALQQIQLQEAAEAAVGSQPAEPSGRGVNSFLNDT